MSAQITAFAQQPLILLAVLLIGIAAGIGVERSLGKSRRRAWRKNKPLTSLRQPAQPSRNKPEPLRPRQPDAVDQLRIVMGADFSSQPLLNRSEARVFRELDRAVLRLNPGWQVMAQVSLGEILRCANPDAYGCINSKRVDLLVVDDQCRPRHAIEYQGGGHHQGTAAARDAIKKEALRRAGIGYHEVVAGQTTPAELRQLVEKLVDRPEPQSSKPDAVTPA